MTNKLTAEQQQLVVDNLGLAVHIAWKWRSWDHRIDNDDMRGEVNLGLVDAARHWRSELGTFRSYAYSSCVRRAAQYRSLCLTGAKNGTYRGRASVTVIPETELTANGGVPAVRLTMSVEPVAELGTLIGQVRRALKSLPAREVRVLLDHCDGVKSGESARQHGVTPQAVRNWRAQGLTQLREELGVHCG